MALSVLSQPDGANLIMPTFKAAANRVQLSCPIGVGGQVFPVPAELIP